jgi:hypothetical protein
VERGGTGGPAAGKGRCRISCGDGGARAVALGFDRERIGRKRMALVVSVGRERNGRPAVQHLQIFHVPRCFPATNQILMGKMPPRECVPTKRYNYRESSPFSTTLINSPRDYRFPFDTQNVTRETIKR